jgi:hypothetical protein
MGLEWEELEQRNRRAQEAPQRVFALGAAVAVAFFGWTYFFSEAREPANPPEVLEAEIVEMPVWWFRRLPSRRHPITRDRHPLALAAKVMWVSMSAK